MKDSIHNVGMVECRKENLKYIDEPWQPLVEFLWREGIRTGACCAGHVGIEGDVFLGWPSETVLEYSLLHHAFRALILAELQGEWQIRSGFRLTSVCPTWWLIQKECPEGGWQEDELLQAHSEIGAFTQEIIPIMKGLEPALD